MVHKHSKPRPHAEFRHRSQIPMPAVAEVEQQLAALLSPSLLAPRQLARRDPRQPARVIRMRQRLLTLPVMVAILVSLVWRRMPAVAEVHKVLAREGLLWVAPLQVSPQAITKRLDVLPATVLGELFAEVCARLHAQAPAPGPHPRWLPVRAHFPLIALVDGSTLEALRKKTQVLRECAGLVLGGKMMVMVEAFSHRPLWQHYTEDAAANDKRFAAEILAALPVGGLLVFDLGFFSFLWFDDFTASHKFFVTRMREKIAYRTVRELSSGPY
jgi:Transposase DDE domain